MNGDISGGPFTTVPTILASSILVHRIKPRHASLATQSESKQLAKQIARRQSLQAQRRRLPMTMTAFYQKLGW